MIATPDTLREGLSGHRIASVRLLAMRSRFPRFLGKNACRGDHGFGENFTVAEITTQYGATGWGLTRRPAACRAAQSLRGALLTEAFDVVKGTAKRWMAFDFALHDLAAVILGMPVYRMLAAVAPKPPASAPIPCYDGAIYMNDLSPDNRPAGLPAILDQCLADWALGYRDFKIKVGRGARWMAAEEGMQRDLDILTMLRRHFPQSRLLVDFNDTGTPEMVADFAERAKELSLYWIEEPFREAREPLLRLREALAKHSPKTKIADGESRPNPEELFALAEEGLLDVLMMDIDSFGFTPWRAQLETLAASRAVGSPHAWGLKMKTHYAAHVAMAASNLTDLEGVLDETEGVDYGGYRMAEGHLLVPDAPGFGMALEWGAPVEP